MSTNVRNISSSHSFIHSININAAYISTNVFKFNTFRIFSTSPNFNPKFFCKIIHITIKVIDKFLLRVKINNLIIILICNSIIIRFPRITKFTHFLNNKSIFITTIAVHKTKFKLVYTHSFGTFHNMTYIFFFSDSRNDRVYANSNKSRIKSTILNKSINSIKKVIHLHNSRFVFSTTKRSNTKMNKFRNFKLSKFFKWKAIMLSNKIHHMKISLFSRLSKFCFNHLFYLFGMKHRVSSLRSNKNARTSTKFFSNNFLFVFTKFIIVTIKSIYSSFYIIFSNFINFRLYFYIRRGGRYIFIFNLICFTFINFWFNYSIKMFNIPTFLSTPFFSRSIFRKFSKSFSNTNISITISSS